MALRQRGNSRVFVQGFTLGCGSFMVYAFRIGEMCRHEADFSMHQRVIHALGDSSFVRISLQNRGDVSDAETSIGCFLLSFLERVDAQAESFWQKGREGPSLGGQKRKGTYSYSGGILRD